LNHLDAEEWRNHKALCRVRRFWLGEPDRHGAFVPHGRAQGGTWAIHYAGQTSSDEETGVRLGRIDSSRTNMYRYVRGRAPAHVQDRAPSIS
jgi:hypothetical protein